MDYDFRLSHDLIWSLYTTEYCSWLREILKVQYVRILLKSKTEGDFVEEVAARGWCAAPHLFGVQQGGQFLHTGPLKNRKTSLIETSTGQPERGRSIKYRFLTNWRVMRTDGWETSVEEVKNSLTRGSGGPDTTRRLFMSSFDHTPNGRWPRWSAATQTLKTPTLVGRQWTHRHWIQSEKCAFVC